MDNLERMRRAAAAKPAPKQPLKQPPKPKGPAKTLAGPTELVKYACGHVVCVAHYQKTKCPKCVSRRRAAVAAERRGGPPVSEPRLPPGSVKTCTWTGAAWEGVLALPDGRRFEFAGASEVACFRGLHRRYLAALKGEGGSGAPS